MHGAGQGEPAGGDAREATRTLLELVATLMQESFERVGEGAVLGTLPASIERFGAMNAAYMNRNFVACNPGAGAVSALTPMNVVSRVTGTDFEMLETTQRRAVKRLKQCEFQDAFEGLDDFPRAMICLLHRAAYQGSVNAGLAPEAGYEVDVRTRILFGDPHCDFVVRSRGPRPETADAECPVTREPAPGERDDLSYAFYTFLLTSFVDYLTNHLPQETVHDVLRTCAAEVGGKVYTLMEAAGRLPDDPVGAARAVLEAGGRAFADDPDGAEDGAGAAEGEVQVTHCPQALHIRSTARANDDPDVARAVRQNACRLCKNLVAGAVDRVEPGCRVERPTALTLGDAACLFRVHRTPPEP